MKIYKQDNAYGPASYAVLLGGNEDVSPIAIFGETRIQEN